MQILNSDGSEAEMCGNGIRCFAKFIAIEKLSSSGSLEIETLAGSIKTEIQGTQVKVDMGSPILAGCDIPLKIPKEKIINEDLWVEDKHFKMTGVSMGNPHCVIFTDKITDEQVLRWGPKIEKHGLFPKKTNVEFARIINEREIRMRVWERGAGETLACGTGACAVAVAGILNKRSGRSVTIHLLGGDLQIEWPAKDSHVFMTGPAEPVFSGTVIG
jgi:diaminopimelate epimerase